MERSKTVEFLKYTALAGLLGIVILQFAPVVNAAETADTIRGVRSPIPVILAGSSTVKNWGTTFPPDHFKPLIISARGVNGEIFPETVDRIEGMGDLCDANGLFIYSGVNDMSSDRVQSIQPSTRLESLKSSLIELTQFVVKKCGNRTKILIAESPETKTRNDAKPETGWLRKMWNNFLKERSGKNFQVIKICKLVLSGADGLHIMPETMKEMGDKGARFFAYGETPEVCP